MEKFGTLSIINKYKKKSGKINRQFCECICDCGNTRTVRYDSLVDGRTKMCKVCAAAKFRKKHGLCKTRQYTIWLDMKQRCSNPKNTAYLYYGAKGISVCDEWKNDFLIFKKWLDENGYSEKMTIDRIDSSAGYNASNCRLITQSENTTLAHLGKKHIRRSKTYGKRH